MKRSRKQLLSLATIALLALIIIVFVIIWQRNDHQSFSAAENHNKAILDQAIQDRNPELCNKLSGKTPYPKYGPTDEYQGFELLDEEAAKQNCTSNATSGSYFGP